MRESTQTCCSANADIVPVVSIIAEVASMLVGSLGLALVAILMKQVCDGSAVVKKHTAI